MIVIIGASASGKSTIQKILCKDGKYKPLVSYTTRKPREGEIDRVDYNFISKSQFRILALQDFFAEIAEYNGWYYGIAKKDVKDDTVGVLTPHGLRMLKKFPELNITSFYLDVPRRNRLIKILERGDNVDEAIRRNLSDVGTFDGVEDEVDYILNNANYEKTPEELAQKIIELVGDSNG